MALCLLVLLLSLRMVHPAACLWHYEFIARLLQGLYKNTYKLRSWLKNAISSQECRQAEEFTRTFWQEIGRFCMATSKPSKDHQGQASVLLHANH
jgi:hypothetical protein